MIYYAMTVIQPMENSKRGISKPNKKKFEEFCAKEDAKKGKPLKNITDELWRLRLTK